MVQGLPENGSGNNIEFRLLCIAELPEIRNNLFFNMPLSFNWGGPGPGGHRSHKITQNHTESHIQHTSHTHTPQITHIHFIT